MPKIVRVGDIEVDVSGVLPLKLGDLKKLKPLGVTPEKMAGVADPDIVSIMATYIIQKVNPAITQDQVDDCTMDELGAIFQDTEAETDRPTSTTSTSSPEPSGGGPES